MTNVRDVRRLKAQQEQRFEPSQGRTWGVIVSVDGSTTPPNNPNMVWVDVLNKSNGRLKVMNDSTLYVEGTPVWLKPVDNKNPLLLKIDGTYNESVNPVTTQELTNYNAPEHGENHQYVTESNVGVDAVKVYQPAIQPLKTTGNGTDLTVTTQALIYLVDGVRRVFVGAETDLTSYVPSVAGQRRWVLLYLDKRTAVLEVLAGMVTSGAIPLPYPTAPVNSIPSAYVKLTNGQTAVTTVTHIEDARGFLNGNGASSPFTATQDGQIIIAIDGSFQVRTPLVNSYGVIMTNNAGEIMTI